jgi:hypothetical protein
MTLRSRTELTPNRGLGHGHAVLAFTLWVLLSLGGPGCGCGGDGQSDAGAGGGGGGGGGGGAGGGAAAGGGTAAGGGLASGGGEAAGGGAAGVDAGPSRAFAIVVTQSPGGSNPNSATWGGVLQYLLPTDGGELQPLPGIDAGLLRDPIAVLFRPATSELFVSNRHGNTAADGIPGSISWFHYASGARDFTLVGTITGNGLNSVHQLAFNPATGELVAASANAAAVSRFLFVDGGFVANGVLTASGLAPRGVHVSPDGRRLSVTSADSRIRQFELDGGAELPSLTLPGAPVLHFFSTLGQTVFVAGLTNNQVYRLDEAPDGTLTFLGSFPAASPIAVVPDPTGLELFTSGHAASDVLERFGLDGGSWVEQRRYPTSFSLGGIELLP